MFMASVDLLERKVDALILFVFSGKRVPQRVPDIM